MYAGADQIGVLTLGRLMHDIAMRDVEPEPVVIRRLSVSFRRKIDLEHDRLVRIRRDTSRLRQRRTVVLIFKGCRFPQDHVAPGRIVVLLVLHLWKSVDALLVNAFGEGIGNKRAARPDERLIAQLRLADIVPHPPVGRREPLIQWPQISHFHPIADDIRTHGFPDRSAQRRFNFIVV